MSTSELFTKVKLQHTHTRVCSICSESMLKKKKKQTQVLNRKRAKSVKSMHCRKQMPASYRRNTVSKQTVPVSQKDTRTLKRKKKKKKVLASPSHRLTPGLMPFNFKCLNKSYNHQFYNPLPAPLSSFPPSLLLLLLLLTGQNYTVCLTTAESAVCSSSVLKCLLQLQQEQM